MKTSHPFKMFVIVVLLAIVLSSGSQVVFAKDTPIDPEILNLASDAITIQLNSLTGQDIALRSMSARTNIMPSALNEEKTSELASMAKEHGLKYTSFTSNFEIIQYKMDKKGKTALLWLQEHRVLFVESSDPEVPTEIGSDIEHKFTFYYRQGYWVLVSDEEVNPFGVKSGGDVYPKPSNSSLQPNADEQSQTVNALSSTRTKVVDYARKYYSSYNSAY